MALATGLCGVGVPPVQAMATGWRTLALTATSTTQAGTTSLILAQAGENVIVNLTTAGGASAALLPAGAAAGDMVWINVLSATSATIFPPVGTTVGPKSSATALTIALGALFVKTSSTTWAVCGGAT